MTLAAAKSALLGTKVRTETRYASSVADVRREQPDLGPVVDQVSDLARRAFMRACEGQETDPRFATEAPIFARLTLLEMCLSFAEGVRRRPASPEKRQSATREALVLAQSGRYGRR